MIIGGFASISSLSTLLLILAGVALGLVFGAIPGLSVNMAVALCLPITYGMDPIQGIAMIMGIYLGGTFGGLITAILINIPGTGASMATTFDGYPMSKKGQGGKALAIGTVVSFIGGTISMILMLLISPSLAKVTLKFTPVEYFAVSLFSITMMASLSGDNIIKGLISGMMGIIFAMVGPAPIDSLARFSFGQHQLTAGFSMIPVLIGCFAIPEILNAAKEKNQLNTDEINKNVKIRGFGFTAKEFIQQLTNIIRSSLIGVGIGILPGIGAGTSNLISYSVAKNTSRTPEKFGTGIIDGVVASETANNATVGGALIPLLTLGIPGDSVTALLIGALMVHGLTPGPLLFQTQGGLMYSIFASLIVANILSLLFMYLGIGFFVRVLSIKKSILMPVIVMLCAVGAFGINNRIFDVICLVMFGFYGYLLIKFDFPVPPIIIGFILGPMVELNMRRALIASDKNPLVFISRPIAVAFLVLTVVSIVLTMRIQTRKKTSLVGKNAMIKDKERK